MFLRSNRFRTMGAGALACAAVVILTSVAHADVSFTAKRMTRDDVPSGKGQCDLRFRVDNEVRLTIRGDRVVIRALAGQESRDEGSECNFPLPVGTINNFRWEKRDGRGRIDLLEEPSSRSGNSAVFNIRDSDGGADRYHIRINWDIEGSSNITDNRPGRGNSGRGGGRNGSNANAGSNSGWGTPTGSGNASGNGWGNSTGWGNVAPPANLVQNGRGTVAWDRRGDLTVSRATVRVTGDQAVIRIDTTANRTVEFRGRISSSSEGLFEVDLDGSSEGVVDGVARVDYRNRNTIERIDLYGNAGNDRFKIDFRR